MPWPHSCGVTLTHSPHGSSHTRWKKDFDLHLLRFSEVSPTAGWQEGGGVKRTKPLLCGFVTISTLRVILVPIRSAEVALVGVWPWSGYPAAREIAGEAGEAGAGTARFS